MSESDLGNVLVIAFDGLDYDRIQKYECKYLQSMEEFGVIDNHTGMSTIKTNELFASFITGENYEEHGIKGLVKPADSPISKAIQRFDKEKLRRKLPAWTTLMEKAKSVTNHKTVAYTKEDINVPTVFDIIPHSKAMFVPSYNTSIFTLVGASLSILESGYSFSLNEYIDLVNREFEYRKRRLFDELDSHSRSFLMCHFHKVDLIQHLEQEEHEDIVREEYQKIDSMAKRIEEYSDYDTIIFMSDHGVPTLESHNKNAFYASNRELFGDKTPKLTDFFSLFVLEKPAESIEDIDF